MNHAESLNVTADGELDIVITRSFAAARAEVFAAATRADRLALWLVGPPGWTMTECEVDLRVGGEFRHEWRGPNGEQMAMGGTYREIAAPERIVRTESFEFGCESQGGDSSRR